MATMMPSDIGEFETEGEKTFYKFLEGVAKPDSHYLCWKKDSGSELKIEIRHHP